MTLQSALQFIASVREDPDLVKLVRDLGPGSTIDRLVALGASRGMIFTTDELREAYRLDWAMRLARYSSRNRPDR
ncbi:MAG: Nif11-like leader peptide family natural product precursor [Gemmatimonadales bacterium]